MFTRIRSFDRSVQLLLVNQFAINIGFYMLMPYLAGHLSHDLGMTAAAVGLILGIRSLSHQGLFLIGGTLADRLGYKKVIVAGCVLRTAGFALLGLVDSIPALLVASGATGFAGALFHPAVRAYLACDAADRRIEAFAIFNIFYQAGLLGGLLVGLALVMVNFQLVCLTAAAVFAALSLVQLRWLPARRAAAPTGTCIRTGVWADWRSVLSNRPFLLFACAVAGSYVLSFQIYLLLPLTLGRYLRGQLSGAAGVGLIFTVSALTAIGGQLRITDWARRRWSAPAAVTRGLLLMAVSFLPLVAYGLAASGGTGPQVLLSAVIACTLMLSLGSALIYPFEMDTIVGLSIGRLVATHYGFFNTIAGIAIAVGNLLTGALLDAAGTGPLPWIILVALGAACGGAVHLLTKSGRLTVSEQPQHAAA